jgi:RNA polymerase-binding transcription factor DksA
MAHKPARKSAPVHKSATAAKKKADKPSKPTAKAKPASPVAKSAKPSKPVAKKVAPKSMSKPKPDLKKPATKAAPAAKPGPTPVAKSKPAPAPAPTKTPAKGSEPKHAPARPVAAAPAPAPTKTALKGKDAVRAKILAQRAKPAKPSSFTLDEVLALARAAAPKATATEAPVNIPVIATKAGKLAPLPAHADKPVAPTKVKAASLADILGFNPRSKASHAESEEDAIPEKFKRYYKLLIELRNHVTGQVDQHSEETLKRSAKEDSGDLSSYGTDGGTDSFDRDFALSLVANEQEALAEIEAAIQRIKSGTYGVCEHTEKPISKERLLAVPFTRYTAEAMKEIEKTRYRVRGQTGILGEGEEGTTKIDDGSDE